MDCSLLPHQRIPHPQILQRELSRNPQNCKICETFLLRKFPAIWMSPGITWHLVSLHMTGFYQALLPGVAVPLTLLCGDTAISFLFLQLHEFDELRFDIRAHDCTYFLRASTVEEKDSWVEAIEANRVSHRHHSLKPRLFSHKLWDKSLAWKSMG